MSDNTKTLERLAIDSVDKYVETMAKKFIDLDRVISKDIFDPYMESCLKSTSQRFRFAVPWNLYGEVADKVLEAISILAWNCQNEREKEICWRLSEVLMNAKLKRLDVQRMPLSLRPIIWKNMNSMTGLEEIDFGYDDEAITNDFISNLRKCPTLRKICMRTSAEECAKLLLGLPYLEAIDMKMCSDLGKVLELVQKSGEFKEPFRLKEINLRHSTTEQLGLLDKMCPKISELAINLNGSETDLCVVKTLDRLTDVTLEDFEFYEQGVDKFLELHGFKIIRLSLVGSGSINLHCTALMHINRSCPNLKVLHLDGIVSIDTFESSTVMCFSPFKHLEKLSLIDCEGTDKLVEFILSGCRDVEDICLTPGVVNEETMIQALAINPMNKLKHLQIDSSMKTIIQILRHRNSELQVDESVKEWEYNDWEYNEYDLNEWDDYDCEDEEMSYLDEWGD